jgi:DNA repair protein RecN (Recombination protein N)
MLALKNVLRRIDPVPVLVFDEVDAGIGGLVAEGVGARLAAIAGERQVLVVTHLAVIAGRADHHLRLSKETERKRTRILLEEVTGADREEELARMMAGTAGGEDARRTARSLLAEENRP